jgi:hypothetical protein
MRQHALRGRSRRCRASGCTPDRVPDLIKARHEMVPLYVDRGGVSYRAQDAAYGVRPVKPFKRVGVPLGDGRAFVARRLPPALAATAVPTGPAV